MIKPAYGLDIGNEFLWGSVGIKSRFPSLGSLINILLPNVYILAGVVLFILLFFGGFMVIAGASGGNPEQTARGGKAAGAALVGFLIIFLSYWIIKIIEVITGMKIFESGY